MNSKIKKDDYPTALAGAREAVRDAWDDLFSCVVQLAFSGQMRGLNQRIPVGTRMRFSPKDFEGVTDPVVVELLSILGRLEALENEIDAAQPSGSLREMLRELRGTAC